MTAHDISAPLILFVDDEVTAVKYFQRAIDSLAPVVTAGSVEEGKFLLDKHASTLAVLVSDQRMPGASGNELLLYAHTYHPHIIRVLTTAYSELEQTIEAVNQGQIHRYIQKPWEISTLRMELKQSLDLAALRREHAQLLREKMIVRQQQIVANRIGALYALCASLAEAGYPTPVDDYLRAIVLVGAKPAEPDWLLMDYAELISAEAYRSGQFGYDVHHQLAEMNQRYADRRGEDALQLLSDMMGDKVQISGTEVVFVDEQNLAEFLESSSDKLVSSQHVSWLVFLIWLQRMGWSLKLDKQESGLRGRLEKSVEIAVNKPASGLISRTHLADWIEQFCDIQGEIRTTPISRGSTD